MLAQRLEPLGANWPPAKTSAFPLKPRRPRHLRCSPGRHGITCPATCLQPPEQPARDPGPGDLCVDTACLRAARSLPCFFSPVATPRQRDPHTVVFLIESSPANLDPRIGTDAQSERIDALLFDGLVTHDASFQFTPALAERWEQPNPLTLIFHLRDGVRFHDGRRSPRAMWSGPSTPCSTPHPAVVISPKPRPMHRSTPSKLPIRARSCFI